MQSSIIGSGAILSSIESLANPIQQKSSPGYSMLIMATNWGFSGSYDAFCAKAKAAGYDGCEVWWPSNETDRKDLFEAVAKHGLKVGYLVGNVEREFGKHESLFKKALTEAAGANPVYINCHSGKDYFTIEQKEKLINHSTAIAKQTGVPIYHETHRGRALYSAPITLELLLKSPELRITLDISHWCAVHESLLDDQEETIAQVLKRTDHIHARIGHPEGPQVSDPRAPEWANAVKAHFAWWDKVVAAKRNAGERITFLTEFGPADYMPTLPFTQQPVADQWAINVYMMEVLRKRYS